MSSLLRSTKFVRYFSGVARTLILNSAKTAEANLLLNSKYLSAANSVLSKDYATKKAESLEPLLQKLDLDVRRFGRITKKDIDEVLDEIKAKNDITSSQSLLVIRCCGDLVPEELPEQRTLLVQKIWNVLTERGIPMDISHYNALLRVYLENEHPFSPAKFLEELETKGLQPNRVTYQRLMWRYCQEGDVDGATKVLEKMRELSMPVSEPVLNALVMGHSFHGDTDGAKAVLDTMAAAGLQPSNRTYMLLASGYAKKGDIAGIESVLNTANEKDVIMTDKDMLDIIENLAIGGHGDKVEELFPHLQRNIGYNQDVCNLILKLLNKGHDGVAKKIMTTMPQTAKGEDSHLSFRGAFFVKQLLKLNKTADEVVRICKELKEENLVPNAVYIASEAAIAHGNSELAQKLFKELEIEGYEIRQHYYWPLLAKKGKDNDEEGLMQVLRDMIAKGIQPTGETLRDFVFPYLIKEDPHSIMMKLQIAGVSIIVSARNLMVELLFSGRLKDAEEIALRYRPRGQYNMVSRPLVIGLSKTRDVDSFANILHVVSIPQNSQMDQDGENHEEKIDITEIGKVVKSAVKNLDKEIDAIEKLLLAVQAKGLRISNESAEEIEQYIGQKMTTTLSETLSRLTSSDLELAPVESPRRNVNYTPRTATELEGLLARMKASDNPGVTRVQRQLITAYINENKVDRLESYLKELETSGFEINVSLLAHLYEFYCLNDLIDKAKECEAKIADLNPEFRLNKFKVVLMAYALVRANKVEDAIKHLTDAQLPIDKEPTGFMYNSKCWQMLNYLAEQKDIESVKGVTKALLDAELIEPSNIILGPTIKVYLLNDDLESALKEFENCCSKYRSTPWKGELMKALIMKEDATRLQWVADLSTQIHGEVNILHDLVLAFVECGRFRQARKILETPGLQTRHKRLDDACQRYTEEGKSEHLEGLLEATKELSHIDRSNIFYHLLVTYCKANETDKALGLWTILQEEGEIPSDKFLTTLGKHLRANQMPVPFILPKSPVAQTKTQNDTEKIVSQNTPKKPTKKETTKLIEDLIGEGKAVEAMDHVIKLLEEKIVPPTSVVKYLLKTLTEAGNVEKIEQFGNHISESLKKEMTYNDKLTSAKFVKGDGPQHIDSLLESMTAATTEADLNAALKNFPRSNALSSIMDNEELVSKCRKIAEIAASKGSTLPANLLWIEYVLGENYQEADSLWDQCLKTSPVFVFRRLLQESHVRKQPKAMEKLIETLKTNKNMTPMTMGNAYSRLINFYLLENRLEQAKKSYEDALSNGVTEKELNNNCLENLKKAGIDQESN